MECLVAAPRSCSVRPGIGSRPMPVMPRIWPGCYALVITAVRVPEREIEAVRDLVRARGRCARRSDAGTAPVIETASAAGDRVLRWDTLDVRASRSGLRRHRFNDIHLKAAFDHSFDAVLAATAARDRLDEQIMVVAASPRFADPVNRLGCLRGISALTGLALTVEIGDWSRFSGPRSALTSAWCPVSTPRATSRGQGSITKAGDTHVRRLLIESAWHHRKSYSTSGPTLRPARPGRPGLRARRARRQPALQQAVAQLHRTRQEPIGRQRRHRPELAGWCWSLATMRSAASTQTWLIQVTDVGAVSEQTCKEPMSHNAIRTVIVSDARL